MAERIEENAGQDAAFAATLAKGMAVLECFSTQTERLSAAALAEATGLTRPTAARLAHTLAELGYLVREPQGRYRLGMRLLSLSHPLLAGLALRQVARPLMQDLAASVRGTVSIGVLDGCDLIYVETARFNHTGSHLPDIGSTVPLLRTALGRALIFMLDKPARVALEKRLAREHPDLWRSMRKALAAGLRSCEARGFCISHGDWVPEIHAVGTPLFTDSTRGPFAINCGLPAFRLRPGELEAELGPRLTTLAATIRAMAGEPNATRSALPPVARTARKRETRAAS